MMPVGVALLHFPVLGRAGEELTATITNLDMHDLARCVRSYGLAALYAVHPYRSQRALAERIRDHWVDGAGGRRIPDRAEALRQLRIVPDLAAACADLVAGTKARARLWATAAGGGAGPLTSYAEARRLLELASEPVLLLFGTSWGLAPTVLASADVRLEPIRARRDTGYNHLSVRAACAITLDRLFG